MTAMTVKAVTPWMGGKRMLADDIIAELGTHTQYFEPFCGSMAVLLAKAPSQKETVNDLHGDLINLARVIQDPDTAPMLYGRLQSAIVAEDSLERAKNYLQSDLFALDLGYSEGTIYAQAIDRAYWYFLASWMGRNGTSGTKRIDYQIAVRWTKNGGSPTVRWRNAVESLPAWHRRLQNVVILNRDAFRIIDRFEDCPQTAIYADPPYVIDGLSRSGVKSSGDASHTYLHEFSNAKPGPGLFAGQEDDHEQLRDCLEAYKHARIVISYYDCEKIRRLYDGWTFVEKSRLKHLHNQRGGVGGKQAPEVLILNGPSLAG